MDKKVCPRCTSSNWRLHTSEEDHKDYSCDDCGREFDKPVDTFTKEERTTTALQHERIFLQDLGGEDVTWAPERIEHTDVEYLRWDIAYGYLSLLLKAVDLLKKIERKRLSSIKDEDLVLEVHSLMDSIHIAMKEVSK